MKMNVENEHFHGISVLYVLITLFFHTSMQNFIIFLHLFHPIPINVEFKIIDIGEVILKFIFIIFYLAIFSSLSSVGAFI